MSEPDSHPEDYSDYFARRSAEELEKAASAPTDFLREQHLELSKVFARLAGKFGGGAG